MQKIAAIDAGSNAMRLLVAELDEVWRVLPANTVRIPVRLGQDVFKGEVLQESTLQRAVDAFVQFRRICDNFGVSHIKAVATSAVREANNRQILIDRIRTASGIELEVISGEEEARLIHLAVFNAMDLDDRRAAMVDIGGGSLEITLSTNGSILSTNSLNLGTVRLLEGVDAGNARHSPLVETKLMQAQVRAARPQVEKALGAQPIDLCIATGGNAEEIGRLAQKLFGRLDNRTILRTDLKKLVNLLAKMPLEKRIQGLDLRPDRADVILPACLILDLAAESAGVEEIFVPEVGLKNGVLLDLALELAEQNHLPLHDQVWESAVRLGKKYQFDLKHGSFVAGLAVDLFDQTAGLHSLPPEARLVLEIAALLHDVGHFINTVDHDRHGHYLLMSNHILGLSQRQQEMVATLLLYHRKGYPYWDAANSKNLSLRDLLIVSKCCALLRLADALDTSHRQRVKKATLAENSSGWCLQVEFNGDISLEKWSLLKRRGLFQEIFNQPLELEA